MMKVFIGGSRKISRLNDEVRARIEKIVGEGFQVFVGDANGADKAVQKYLAEQEYERVVVFCTGSFCRNNVYHWETRQIQSDRQKRDFQFYAAKDAAMSNEADYGLMLWDGKSVGTLNNVLNMINSSKKVVVYYAPEKEFISVQSQEDVEVLLAKCAPEEIQRFEKRLNLPRPNGVYQGNLPFEH